MGLFSRKNSSVAYPSSGQPGWDDQLRTPANTPRVSTETFLENATAHVLGALRSKVQQSKENPGAEGPDYKRFALLDRMLTVDSEQEALGGRSRLERIVRGYLAEFLRQTVDQIEPCNVRSGTVDRSDVKCYWDSQSADALWLAAGAGVYHSAFAYNALRETLRADLGTGVGRTGAWGALVEVVRHSVQGFKQVWAATYPGVEPRASVYNDHEKVLRYSVMLDRHRLGFARAS